jgi:hypothetical protein
MLFPVIFSFIYVRFATTPTTTPTTCNGTAGGLSTLQTTILNLIGNVTGLMTGIGVVVCIAGIIVGGLMRATAFGNERKVAQSNQAIACAVIGLVIVGLAQIAGPAVGSILGCPTGTGA